jgi:hypothetical protein
MTVIREQHITETENEKILEEHPHSEGFFPCPFCTCWFTHKHDLNVHVKKFCRRKSFLR